MATSPVFDIAIIALLILLNGALSLSELAFVTARKHKLESLAGRGDPKALAAVELLNNTPRLFSTIQVGITFIGILSGVFAGATLAVHFGSYLTAIGMSEAGAELLSGAIVITAITYFSLIFGELLPKQLALLAPERLARFAAPLLSLLSKATRPVVWLLEKSSTGILALFRVQRHADLISEEDVSALLTRARKDQVIEPAEEAIAGKVFKLGDRTAGSLMTARPDVVWLTPGMSEEKLRETVENEGYSHYPLLDERGEKILGVVSAKALFVRKARGEPLNLTEFTEEPIEIPATIPALDVLERFKQSGDRMAVVIDEHGSFEGIITLHDTLEAMVGELKTHENEQPGISKRPDGSYLVDGSMTLEDVFSQIGAGHLIPDEKRPFNSIGGLVVNQLKRIPKPGDRFDYDGLTFEVVDMDDQRVDKVILFAPPGHAAAK